MGDILMHRMMLEDFKILMPDAKITFACPKIYHDAIIDHPFVDHVVETYDENNFGVSYDTSFACNKYEMNKAPYSDKHRSDIWAEHCGLNLTKRNMHIRLTDKEKQWAIEKLPQDKIKIAFAPISAMQGKNLDFDVISEIVDRLKNHYTFILHTKPIEGIKVPQMTGCTIRQFMGLIGQSDAIVSVDSAAFHCAGGMGKPLVGIFSWADGKVYGKYYNFELVQKHRDDGNWDCGPCYNFAKCPKVVELTKLRKPCITEISSSDIIAAVDKMLSKMHT